MTEFGAQLVKRMNNSVIFKEWPGGIVDGLVYQQGVLDNTPLWKFLNDTIAETGATKIHRKLVISAGDVNTGSYHAFNESVGIENLATVIKASASIPGAFPPTHFQGGTYMDGGTIWNTNLVTAIKRCLETVQDESQIVLDVIISDSIYEQEEDKVSKDAFDNYMRQQEFKKYGNYFDDYWEFKRGFPKVQYRHLIQPSAKVPMGALVIDFSPKMVNYLFELGKKDGKTALEIIE